MKVKIKCPYKIKKNKNFIKANQNFLKKALGKPKLKKKIL
jgi:hypothetical protein